MAGTHHHYDGCPVLFSFQEGQFGYQCAGCDVPCCREVNALFVSRSQEALIPELGLGSYVSLIAPDVVMANMGPGGCPALEATGLCRIHRERGRRDKPALCSLFPFSRLVRTETFLLIAPNLTFVCPLRLDARPDDTTHRYEEILQDLDHYFKQSATMFQAVAIPEGGGTTLEHEAVLVDLANQRRGQATIEALHAEVAGEDEMEVEARLGVALEVLGLELSNVTPELGAELLPLLPSLRVDFYELPRAVLDTVMALGSRLVADAARTAARPLSIRRVANIYWTQRELLRLCALAEWPISLGAEPVPAASSDPEILEQLDTILSVMGTEPAGVTLRELLRAHCQLHGVRRVTLLHLLAANRFVFG